jgi:hypothetical protein
VCELHKNMLFYASNVSEISMAIKLCLRAHDGLFYLFSTVVVILLKNIYVYIYIYVYILGWSSQRKKGQVSLSHGLQNIIKLYIFIARNIL